MQPASGMFEWGTTNVYLCALKLSSIQQIFSPIHFQPESKLCLAKTHLSKCYCTSLIPLTNHTWLEIKRCKILWTGKTMLKNSGTEHTTFTHLVCLNMSIATSFSTKISQLPFLQLYTFYTSEASFWCVKVRTSRVRDRLSKNFIDHAKSTWLLINKVQYNTLKIYVVTHNNYNLISSNTVLSSHVQVTVTSKL